jgi:hypothetical protein
MFDRYLGSLRLVRPSQKGDPMRTGSLILALWLIIGIIAAGQRDYFTHEVKNCSRALTITVTIIAGPLNYVGVNPKINCKTPEPSK